MLSLGATVDSCIVSVGFFAWCFLALIPRYLDIATSMYGVPEYSPFYTSEVCLGSCYNLGAWKH